jgi:hypothetical protein
VDATETDLYVTDTTNHTIRKVVIDTTIPASPTYVSVETFAGKAGVSGITNGVGSAARFQYPYGITTDGTNLYVTDTNNHTIRKIVIGTAEVSRLAGKAGTQGKADSGLADTTGANARFNRPYGIVYDLTTNLLYVADHDNHAIRTVDRTSGVTDTLAGIKGTAGKHDDATGTLATFRFPAGVAVDGSFVYVSDTENHTIRTINLTGPNEVLTKAGLAGTAGAVNAAGTTARFYKPTGLYLTGTTLYVVDWLNQVIRTVDTLSWSVAKVAGQWQPAATPKLGIYGYQNDPDGANALFNFPSGIAAVNGTAPFYVVDTSNQAIRTMDPASPYAVDLLVGVPGVTGSSDQ